MRRPLDLERLQQFMRALGARAEHPGRVYFTGGASALVVGWRSSTVDADIKLVPEQDALFRALPDLKERLELNVELASPDDFIPELAGWQERSPFITRESKLTFHHYDFHAQALAKLERGHSRDIGDVKEIARRGLISPPRLLDLWREIEPRLYRFPAIDPPSFRRAVEGFVAGWSGE